MHALNIFDFASQNQFIRKSLGLLHFGLRSMNFLAQGDL